MFPSIQNGLLCNDSGHITPKTFEQVQTSFCVWFVQCSVNLKVLLHFVYPMVGLCFCTILFVQCSVNLKVLLHFVYPMVGLCFCSIRCTSFPRFKEKYCCNTYWRQLLAAHVRADSPVYYWHPFNGCPLHVPWRGNASITLTLPISPPLLIQAPFRDLNIAMASVPRY